MRTQARERAAETATVTAFVRGDEWAPHRQALERLYAAQGFVPAAGKSAAEDFIELAMKSFADESISQDERFAILGNFLAPLGLDRRALGDFHASLEGMYAADRLSLRMAAKDDRDDFRDGGLPDQARFAAERENDGRSVRNAVTVAAERHGWNPDREMRRSIDSQRHLAVRDAVDKHTGSRPLDPGIDRVDMGRTAEREAADWMERKAEMAAREPTIRESLAGAFERHEENQ